MRYARKRPSFSFGLGRVMSPFAVWPELGPDAKTETMLRNLTAPARNPSAWDAKTKQVFAAALGQVGTEAAFLARQSLTQGLQAEPAHWPTVALRERNRTEAPLREYGRLARSIVARVTESGLSVTVGVAEGSTAVRRRGQGAMSMAALARNLENGFVQRVTDRAVAYFKAQALHYQRASAARAAAGERQQFGARRKLGRAALLSQQAKAWWFLYNRGPGTFAVAPRPFLRPAVEQAAVNFIAREGELGMLLLRMWITGAAPAAGVVRWRKGVVSGQTVRAPLSSGEG